MLIRKKLMIVGMAGVAAIGSGGLYAGMLSVTSAGNLGAGTVALQASCADAAIVTPGDAVWDEVEMAWVYPDATISYTPGATTCLGQVAQLIVYDNITGVPFNSADSYTILAGDVAATSFVVDFTVPGVDAAIDADLYNYGLVIQGS